MGKTPALQPRKAGTQSRSRETVKALVEATARVLVKDGFHSTNTNRIADEAGVSVGSLYQYFPNKEALVVAVIDRHKSEMMAVLDSTLRTACSMPLEDAFRALVRMMIEAHRVNPRLHRVLVADVPRSGRLGEVETFDRDAYAAIKAFLETRRREMREMDLDLAAYICVKSTEALVHGAVVDHPEWLADNRVERFVDEATKLIVGYLR
ncbi:MAG TPA: TetR/AcrR family transcriptional regulator [Devosiaceae bacterium]|jgi:AcrR family transcriptional regulator|nr:TetR/AcrR family transcriptional regulator [Devosiaceae bacterium]